MRKRKEEGQLQVVRQETEIGNICKGLYLYESVKDLSREGKQNKTKTAPSTLAIISRFKSLQNGLEQILGYFQK